MGQDAERAEQFLAWVKDEDPSVRLVDWRRVTLELLERAGGEVVTAEHVDELVDHYRRSLLGPRNIIMAAEVGELLVTWQAIAPPPPRQPSPPPPPRQPSPPPPPPEPRSEFSPPSSPGAEFSPPSPGAEFSPPSSPLAELTLPSPELRPSEPSDAFAPYSPPTPPGQRMVASDFPEDDRDFAPQTSPGVGVPFKPSGLSRAVTAPPGSQSEDSKETKAKPRSRRGSMAEALDLANESLELDLDFEGDSSDPKSKG